jgi:hypothetical protein
MMIAARFARLAAAAMLTAPLVACAETRTIRGHGFPAFEEVAGPATPYRRADDREVEGRNLVSEGAADGPHKIFMTITPFGTDADVLLEVRAKAQDVSASKVELVAVAAHPLAFAQIGPYRRDGVLPSAAAPLAVQSTTTQNEEGVVKLIFKMPRSAIPPGTERLAMPILVRYADGWVYVRFYETGIPAPVPDLDPATMGQPMDGGPQPPGPRPGGTPPGGEGATPPR